MMFRPHNQSSSVTALISFPGSGSTWIRRIIEEATGVYTGAIYCDNSLKLKGFYGEVLNVYGRIFVFWSTKKCQIWS